MILKSIFSFVKGARNTDLWIGIENVESVTCTSVEECTANGLKWIDGSDFDDTLIRDYMNINVEAGHGCATLQLDAFMELPGDGLLQAKLNVKSQGDCEPTDQNAKKQVICQSTCNNLHTNSPVSNKCQTKTNKNNFH